jgi:hypothetical protein
MGLAAPANAGEVEELSCMHVTCHPIAFNTDAASRMKKAPVTSTYVGDSCINSVVAVRLCQCCETERMSWQFECLICSSHEKASWHYSEPY